MDKVKGFTLIEIIIVVAIIAILATVAVGSYKQQKLNSKMSVKSTYQDPWAAATTPERECMEINGKKFCEERE